MPKENGIFIISLDFELQWGVGPGEDSIQYRKSVLGGRYAIPLMLKLFKEYNIHSTWATVGLLFFENRDELMAEIPKKRPNYANSCLSSYNQLQYLGENENEDPYHYAGSLIRMIKSFPGQEIGSHTFSHYCCMEKGQNIETFEMDLKAAMNAAKKYEVKIKSMVFPFNQINKDYLHICKELGITSYRGNPSHPIYKEISTDRLALKKAIRLIDTFLNVTGYNCYSIDDINRCVPFDIRCSRFLRSYSERLKFLEMSKIHRIMSELTFAARNGLVYHLYWHPYNFGLNQDKNMNLLKKILSHFAYLRETYGMESLNMGQLSERLFYLGLQ